MLYCYSKDLYDKKALELLDIDVIGEIITVQQKLEPKKNTLEQSIETYIKEVTTIDQQLEEIL
jgi:hypothetical protein